MENDNSPIKLEITHDKLVDILMHADYLGGLS